MRWGYGYKLGIQHIILVVCVLGGLILFYLYFDNHNWPEVSGRVVATKTAQDGTRKRYYCIVQYLYVVDHASHLGEVTIGQPYRYEDAARNYLNSQTQYYVGQHLRVVYNPIQPESSSLTRAWF